MAITQFANGNPLRKVEAAQGAEPVAVSLHQLKGRCGASVSRAMRVASVMMRNAMRQRAHHGAVGVDRLKTGAHEGYYEAADRGVKGPHVAGWLAQTA